MSATTDRLRVSELARFGPARTPIAVDAIDGVMPGALVEPETGEQMAALLAWASTERLTTVIRGGGTKLGWGATPRSIDLVVATARLNRMVAHRHGDLTATVQAGATLTATNGELAKEQQWLPIDSAFDAATIGGIVATNESGPLRSRYGTPRDLVIGVTLAMTDGRLVKSGGHVVKNVAGYDLGKLMSGSFGTLAAIVDVTLKLLPVPAASRTLVFRYPDSGTLSQDAARLSASQLEPVAFDIRVHHGSGGETHRQLLVRFATSPEAVDAQADAARSLLAGGTESIAEPEAVLWRDQTRQPWTGSGAVIRVGWLPASLPRVLDVLDALEGPGGRSIGFHGRVMTGAGLIGLDADDAAVERAVALLRSRPAVVSNVVLLRLSPALKARLDVWGTARGPAAVLQSLKKTFDPAGILNAGRGPL
jgi:glycolate oxidase FAD binding subunit